MNKNNNYLNKIEDEKVNNEIWDFIHKKLKGEFLEKLIVKMLEKDPQNRLNLDQVIKNLEYLIKNDKSNTII